ncbi:MAG: hypothetical protein IJZ60_08440 [Bacteroides sp.]|nr:hypothetical protein [Bacteroides sp.]
MTRMKSLRGKLAVLCPETDGLQAKHRIKRVLKGKTHQERIEEMLSILGNEIQFDKICFTKLLSRIISLVYDFEGFSSSEVYQILKNEYFKNFR